MHHSLTLQAVGNWTSPPTINKSHTNLSFAIRKCAFRARTYFIRAIKDRVRTIAKYLGLVAVALNPGAALAQTAVDSIAGCAGAWSSGSCWQNFLHVPPDSAPAFMPPVAGQLVFIVPFSTITLDVDAQQARLDVNGGLNQPSSNLAINGVLTISGTSVSSGTYQLSGGTLRAHFKMKIGLVN